MSVQAVLAKFCLEEHSRDGRPGIELWSDVALNNGRHGVVTGANTKMALISLLDWAYQELESETAPARMDGETELAWLLRLQVWCNELIDVVRDTDCAARS